MFDPNSNTIPTFFVLLGRNDPTSGETVYSPVAQGAVLCDTTTVLRWHGPAVHSVGVYSTFIEMAEQVTNNGLKLLPASPGSSLYAGEYSDQVLASLIAHPTPAGLAPVPGDQDYLGDSESYMSGGDEPDEAELTEALAAFDSAQEERRHGGVMHDADEIRRMASLIQESTQQIHQRHLQEALAEGVTEDGDGYLAN